MKWKRENRRKSQIGFGEHFERNGRKMMKSLHSQFDASKSDNCVFLWFCSEIFGDKLLGRERNNGGNKYIKRRPKGSIGRANRKGIN